MSEAEKSFVAKDGRVYEYIDESDDQGYFYRIHVSCDGKDAWLVVLNDGLDIDFPNGGFIDVGVAPKDIFPGKDRLTEDDLARLIEFMGAERSGTYYSKENADAFYQEYLQQQGEDDEKPHD